MEQMPAQFLYSLQEVADINGALSEQVRLQAIDLLKRQDLRLELWKYPTEKEILSRKPLGRYVEDFRAAKFPRSLQRPIVVRAEIALRYLVLGCPSSLLVSEGSLPLFEGVNLRGFETRLPDPAEPIILFKADFTLIRIGPVRLDLTKRAGKAFKFIFDNQKNGNPDTLKTDVMVHLGDKTSRFSDVFEEDAKCRLLKDGRNNRFTSLRLPIECFRLD